MDCFASVGESKVETHSSDETQTMSENLDRLRETLEELESELQSIDSLDETSRAKLEEVAVEIREALDKPDPGQIDSRSLYERLEDSVEEFEATHPRLVQFFTRLSDGLGQMGI